MWPCEVVETLPLVEFGFEIDVALVTEELIEFLLIGSVRALRIPVELWRALFDVKAVAMFSIAARFHVPTCFASHTCFACVAGSFACVARNRCTPYFLDSLASVISLRIASRTTLALKSGEWFFRFFILDRHFHHDIHLNIWSEFPRPPLISTYNPKFKYRYLSRHHNQIRFF